MSPDENYYLQYSVRIWYMAKATCDATSSVGVRTIPCTRYKVPLREVRSGVAQERNPSIPHLTACGQIRCTWCSADYVLVRSSSVVWGNALPGTVRSLPVVVENRKEVVFPSHRVQHEYDEDFLYG